MRGWVTGTGVAAGWEAGCWAATVVGLGVTDWGEEAAVVVGWAGGAERSGGGTVARTHLPPASTTF